MVSTGFLNSHGPTALPPLPLHKIGIIPLFLTRLLLENLFIAARHPVATGVFKAHTFCIFPYKCLLGRV